MSCNFSWAPDLLGRVGCGCSDTGSFFHLTDTLSSAALSSLPGAACRPKGAAAGPGQVAGAPQGQHTLRRSEDFRTSSFAFWSFSVQVSW